MLTGFSRYVEIYQQDKRHLCSQIIAFKITIQVFQVNYKANRVQMNVGSPQNQIYQSDHLQRREKMITYVV